MIAPAPYYPGQVERPILRTARLLLRRPHEGDFDAIVAIAANWEVARRLASVPHPRRPEHTRFFLALIVPRDLVWAITLRVSGALVGMIGLSPDQDRIAWELAYWIARARWGQGIATEARQMGVYHARMLGLSVICSDYFTDNPASGRVLQKLGFVETGRGQRPCAAVGSTLASLGMRLALQ